MSTKKELRKVQIEVIAALQRNKGVTGTVHAVMRSGKTAALIYHIDKNYKNPLWLAENTSERDVNLKTEFEDWGFLNYYKNNLTVIHPDSLHTVDLLDYDVIVYNECHSITDKRFEQLLKAECPILGMTGTYPKNHEKLELFKKLGLNNILFEYLIEDGRKDGVISDYNFVVYRVPLEIEKNLTVSYKDKKTGNRKSFVTSELSSYNSLTVKIDNALGNNQQKFARINRMRAVSKFQSKILFCQKMLLENSKNKERTLLFAMDNEHAKKIGPKIYSSKTEDKALKEFEEFKSNYLILVEKLGTGYNFNKIRHIILSAPNSSNTKTLQKAGRGLIKDLKEPLKISLVVSKDTVQESWVRKSLADIPSDLIKWVDVNPTVANPSIFK